MCVEKGDEEEKKKMTKHPYMILYLLGRVRMMIPVVSIGALKSDWKLKTVEEFNFHRAARLDMEGRTRSVAIVRPEDDIVGRALVIDKVIYHLNPGDAIVIGPNVYRLLDRLESSRQVD